MNSASHRILLVTALLASLVCSSNAADSAPAEGRAGSWRKGAQGAPDLKAAQLKVEKNPKDAEALNDLGFALRQNGKLDEAQNYLKQALEIKPEMGSAHANLSVVYYDQSKTADALREAQAAVKTDANNAIFRVILGNALSKTGDLKGAAQEYKLAIHLQPDYENAIYHLGRVLAEDGDLNEAKYQLAKALSLDPKDERVVALLDKLERGEVGSGKGASGGAGAAAGSGASAKQAQADRELAKRVKSKPQDTKYEDLINPEEKSPR